MNETKLMRQNKIYKTGPQKRINHMILKQKVKLNLK